MEQTKIILVAVVAILFWAAHAFLLVCILLKRTFCRWHERMSLSSTLLARRTVATTPGSALCAFIISFT
jgi:uncharacterized membrane protein YqjE